jgi:hypothetical protein
VRPHHPTLLPSPQVDESQDRDSQTPEEILEGAWARVESLRPPLDEPAPGKEWHFAVGAQWALGTAGLLTDEQARRWDAHGEHQAKRLGAQSKD